MPVTRQMRGGFTLLEAMVALAVIALVCIGVLGAFGGALRADARAADRLPLSALAVERIAAIDIGSSSLARLPDSLASGMFSSPYDKVSWVASTSAVRGAPGLYDVVVKVSENTDAFVLRTRRYRPSALAVAVR